MVPMRLGRRLVLPAAALAAVVAPTVAGCGLFDTGSTLEEALEYLPADTFSVEFADRAAMSERLGLDDIDPRGVTEGELDDYLESLQDPDNDAVAVTELASYARVMADAPINTFDVEWEARASWGDPDDQDGTAFVWKVGDDLDFDALAEDLADKGYDEDDSGDLPVYTADRSATTEDGLVGGVYPPLMYNVLLDEDEQLVVASVVPDPLGDVADVIADDEDSLADGGGMDELLDTAEGDPELALLVTGGPTVCRAGGRPLPEQVSGEYDDLGRPDARALFVSADDPKVLLALQYDSEDAAEDDLEAREDLIDDGVDPLAVVPFDQLGDFELDQDGEFVLIEEDFDDGAAAARRVELSGGGPGFCLSAAD